MNQHRLKLFALNRSRDFGRQVADAIGLELAAHEEREFEDGLRRPPGARLARYQYLLNDFLS